uniref:C-type lectin domain-containing protein n=1 Tax=Gouania willdenowi TaxID=441366 RepID=A0A8C5G398_GOUWI
CLVFGSRLVFLLSMYSFTVNLCIFLSYSHCSVGWLANGRSCYSVRRAERTWSVAQRTCSSLISGGHLADLKIPEDRLLHSKTFKEYLQSFTATNYCTHKPK